MRNHLDIVVESILEKPDLPVLGNSTLIQKMHFRKICIVSGPYFCKTVGMLKYLETYRQIMHVQCTELQHLKKCRHFRMQKTDNETFEYNDNNNDVVQSGVIFYYENL